MMTPLIVENVFKAYKQGDRAVQALDGVSLSVERGQFLAVMGASGSGKSTLLHLIAGLTSPMRARASASPASNRTSSSFRPVATSRLAATREGSIASCCSCLVALVPYVQNGI